MINLKGKRAILYRRVSTTDQKENGNSLNTQRHGLQEFVLKNGMKVIREFEEDFSAKNFERPEFNKLREYVEANKTGVDYILITSWDRFSRNAYQGLREILEMRQLQVEINCVENWVDHEDPQQYMMLLLYLGMPEVDNKIKSQKVKLNMRQGLKEGRWNRAQPLGYIPGKDPVNPKRPLMQVDAVKGPLISEFFQDFASGIYSQNELRNRPKYAPLKISKSNVSRILRNEVYTGKIRVPAYKGEPEELIEGLHEAIVEWDTFQKVQFILDGKSRYKQNPSKLNENLPLRGHLKCAKCGGNLTGSGSKSKTGKKHFYYHCNTRKGCDIRFRADLAHSSFDKILSEFRVEEEVVELFKLILEEKFKTWNSAKYRNIETLEKDICKAEERKSILLNKLLESVISDEVYKNQETLLNEQIFQKRSQLTSLNTNQGDLERYLDNSALIIRNFKYLYEKAEISIKQKLLSSILKEKLVFSNEKYRTPKLKEGASFIFLNFSKLQEKKRKKGNDLANVSLKVPGAGLEPARTLLPTGF